MMRLLIILLLLAVFFFGGISYGSKDISNARTDVENIVEQEIEIIDHIDIIPYELEKNNLEQETSAITKLASFFDGVVTAFYEMLIVIMYNVSGLFFD